MTFLLPPSIKGLRKIQKDSKSLKSNYRPVSILGKIFKIFGMYIYGQLVNHFDQIFFKISVWFPKGFSVQQCLVALMELWKASLDNKNACRALLADLSKTSSCFNH